MTNQIGTGTQTPLGQNTASFTRERSFAEGRAADARGGASLEAKPRTGGRTAMTDAMHDRQAAFQRSILRHASTAEGDAPEARLLAPAEWSGSAFALPMPQQQSQLPDNEPVAQATQTLASSIAARIEQAFRAELLALTTSPTTVAIDLGGLAGGLQQLTVTMTPTALDVTIAHEMATLPEELLQATQALAEQLARRFAGRTVRILQAASTNADPDKREENELQTISSLLSRAADTR